MYTAVKVEGGRRRGVACENRGRRDREGRKGQHKKKGRRRGGESKTRGEVKIREKRAELSKAEKRNNWRKLMVCE